MLRSHECYIVTNALRANASRMSSTDIKYEVGIKSSIFQL